MHYGTEAEHILEGVHSFLLTEDPPNLIDTGCSKQPGYSIKGSTERDSATTSTPGHEMRYLLPLRRNDGRLAF
ncbi:hypothetical protein C8034_v008229 [Colletotrichum sidae]|uniref:Uncharacterized protein n=2 Tax=Colletotrichum orbiculare species complex TaxID=2707354 RepID=A0A4R8QIA7_9PEZI|nr:hypothetical protein C8035_v007639 [Colletotrichum spinosum]TEA20862.1 hypothetical protein C8034_v008229 [Colletotrichum sidae]